MYIFFRECESFFSTGLTCERLFPRCSAAKTTLCNTFLTVWAQTTLPKLEAISFA